MIKRNKIGLVEILLFNYYVSDWREQCDVTVQLIQTATCKIEANVYQSKRHNLKELLY